MNGVTWAIILDAYRDLNSRKMFWIVLWLSVLAIGAFGLVGADKHSLSVLWWNISDKIPDAQLVYKYVFSTLVVGFYFTFIATILALISTASIFPDFMAGGAVDLYLSKPVGRVRMFLTKYVAGLLFVALQVTIFTVGSFLVLGIRGHEWVPSLFLAIPIVLAFFSYLFGICVFFGVMTQSTLAALLLTMLAWFFCWAVDKTDGVLTALVMQGPTQRENAQHEVDRLDRIIAAKKASTQAAATQFSGRARYESVEQLENQRDAFQKQAAEKEDVPAGLVMAQEIVVGLKTFVPKTRETTDLLDRYLLPESELKQAVNNSGDNDDTSRTIFSATAADPMRQRSAWWVMGTSLGFEAVCVGWAAWIFKRRDF